MPIRSPSDSENQRARLLDLVAQFRSRVRDAAKPLGLDDGFFLNLGKRNFFKAKILGIASSEDLISKLQEFNSTEEWRHSELRESFHSQSGVCQKLDDLFVTLQSFRTLLNSLDDDEISEYLSGASGAPSNTASSPIPG